MSFEATVAIAQILPALLVAGVLGPILLGWRIEPPERFLFATQTVIVTAVEGVLIWFIMEDEPLPEGFTGFVWMAVMVTLLGVVFVAIAWARRSGAERQHEERLRTARKRRGRRRKR
ncbi:hypothetical protein SAMN06295885_0451 [Rathayibacter oskolensis]|uniref:Uncharacterized protein n=1 Tax=Rathayibacter oskolensis TaxID=1891671 RepID=A0A1X7N2H2_9MICO|nr:hypothetical protein [Rathayibacter oskolensis]SMH30648.1 hypothetical protein SAMN06295885_0451 [Rathayibacter oskolensis]